MAGEWVENYMRSWSNDERDREIGLRKAQFVSTGSLPFFKTIWDQVEKDLTLFHEQGGDRRLLGQFIPSRRFRVRRAEYPVIELDVQLKDGYLECAYKEKFDNNSELLTRTIRLTICSDLQGRLQVRRNGETFADQSEVSEFLLTPVFEYLRKNR